MTNWKGLCKNINFSYLYWYINNIEKIEKSKGESYKKQKTWITKTPMEVGNGMHTNKPSNKDDWMMSSIYIRMVVNGQQEPVRKQPNTVSWKF
jgi:hypothetical protein